jgi:DNA (cytosine-5)-methyltransferase 3A
MMLEDIPIDRYVAYEIDKYAIQTATHNFPDIEERGDVFEADFTEFEGFDWLIGGSPCTYWSIAQKNNRETEASGLGWELFCQYTRALREAKPKWFIYENNKSMSKAIRDSITEAFGFEPICINSALVSAQNRQRLYWVGRRNEDGTYSKVDVPQPEDRGILLKDILEGWKPVALNSTDEGDKVRTLMAGYYKYGTATLITNKGFKGGTTAVAESVCPMGRDKSRTLTSGYVACSQRDRCMDIATNGFMGKQSVAEPIYIGAVPENNGTYLNGKQPSQQYRVYDRDGKGVAVTTAAITNVAEPVKVGEVNGGGQGNRIYSIDGKSVAQTATSGGLGSNTGLYAIQVEEQSKCGYATPTEWDEDGRPIKAVSCADGKVYTVYEVKDGKITIKDKEYPIKLVDGFYIIRKLTVRECTRLQTVPEWYEFPVSDSRAYMLLGNGWTIEVIRGLIRAVKNGGRGDEENA